MISYLSGKIILKKHGLVIIDVSGVGYEVFVSSSTFDILPEKGSILNLFCYLDVTERSLKLFGFTGHDELELFKVVRNISGVGPKAALEISSVGSLGKIKEKMDKNADIFEGTPGIGKKKAQKIVLELSGKLKTLDVKQKKKHDNFENDEAFTALLNLGFPKDKVGEALSQVAGNARTIHDKVTKALQILGK